MAKSGIFKLNISKKGRSAELAAKCFPQSVLHFEICPIGSIIKGQKSLKLKKLVNDSK
jgi:hypothetical protein